MNWDYDIFRAYLFLEMAHGDMDFSSAEKEYILSKIDNDHYEKVKKEYDNDSDFEKAQKLMKGAKLFCQDEEVKNTIITELKELCKSDGKVCVEEKNLLLYLKRLIG